jgi:hypothetical protein
LATNIHTDGEDSSPGYRFSKSRKDSPWHKSLPSSAIIALGKDFLKGMKIKDLALKYGINRRTVLRIRKRLKLER